MKMEHFHKSKAKYAEFIYRTFKPINIVADKSEKELHIKMASDVRATNMLRGDIHIEDVNFLKDIKTTPILFEDICCTSHNL